MDDKFVFIWDNGVGFCKPKPDNNEIYNKEYFDKYVKYENTELGESINKARFDMVRTGNPKSLLDVGIGCGSFLRFCKNNNPDMNLYGLDVNQYGIEWLKFNNMVYEEQETVDTITYWDSFEHILRPFVLIDKIKPKNIFISIPIFEKWEDVFKSKHFRPDEHIWYFSQEGLINQFREKGYEWKKVWNIETLLGRESIWSFHFVKKESK